MPMWMAINFQNSNSPIMEHFNFFHDHNMMMISFITMIVMILMISSLSSSFFNRFFVENQEIEYFWTSMPAFLLLFLAFPSMKILYMSEEMFNSSMMVKVTGYQWYWNYQMPNIMKLSFDSFMIPSNSMRLLDTSNHLILPTNTNIKILVTSNDVIHSWTVPSLGIKTDAIPGRLNQINTMIIRSGIFTGQCSEICGVNHSFMPITITSMPMKNFISSL